jgi:hypothetical protein
MSFVLFRQHRYSCDRSAFGSIFAIEPHARQLRDAIQRAHRGARSLFLAEGTVKNYVSEIPEKLGMRDRTRAVLRAITLRIV